MFTGQNYWSSEYFVPRLFRKGDITISGCIIFATLSMSLDNAGRGSRPCWSI